jgi:hypothetical protein
MPTSNSLKSDSSDINTTQINDFSNKKKNTKIEQIYIKHTDSKIVYCLNNAWSNSQFLQEIVNNINDNYGSEINPIILTNEIKSHTIEFIVNYLNYYNKKTEINPPSTPLPAIHISEIFGNEYDLFKHLFDETKNLSDNITYLSDFINTANHFNMEILTKKLCSIIAYLLKEFKGDLQKLIPVK